MSTNSEFPSPEVVEMPERHLMVVRERVPLDRIPELYDRAYPLIFAVLADAGMTPSAAPMGVVHGEPGETLDLSVAVPVPEPCAGSDTVVPEVLPAGRVATLLVRGDYSQLASAYEHLFTWIATQGFTPAGISWEQYLTEPEPGADPAGNETLIGALLTD